MDTTGYLENDESRVRRRPALFRALGDREPPDQIDIGSQSYDIERVFKHDSWAATALYSNRRNRVVCKFNREQPIGLVGMSWAGKRLAEREAFFLKELEDLSSTPRYVGPVLHNGTILRNAVAHEFIEGKPLAKNQRVNDAFFPTLEQMFDEIHRRQIAYVDLHKRENILVGTDGRPYLIDFQIAYSLPRHRSQHLIGAATILDWLQAGDRYHLLKHWHKCRPDTFPESQTNMESHRPSWIKGHRLFAKPYRSLRRWFLSQLGVRNRTGRAESELFAEEALRSDRRAA